MFSFLATIGIFLIKSALFLTIAGLGFYVTYYMLKQLITARKAPKDGTMFAYILFMFMATMMLFSFVNPKSENTVVQKVSAGDEPFLEEHDQWVESKSKDDLPLEVREACTRAGQRIAWCYAGNDEECTVLAEKTEQHFYEKRWGSTDVCDKITRGFLLESSTLEKILHRSL